MEIVRALDLSYIWVDSLCIVQDDPEDWRKESALMSSVYGNATVNIAASSAEDGSGGCFFDRVPSWRCQVETVINGQSQLYNCATGRMYRHDLVDMPLGKRGWALQERLLPPRTLHFTSTQIYWECHQKTACETFPDTFPLALSESRDYLHKQPITRSMWPWIVERYSRCQLTYRRDKLVAISGLARNIQLQTNEQYVAGLWREDIELQLCWHKVHEPIAPRWIPYTAPTWSWASIEGSIDFHELSGSTHRKDLDIQVLKVKIRSADQDGFGEIIHGSLQISCRHILRGEIFEQGHITYLSLGETVIKVVVYFDYLVAVGGTFYVLPIVGYGEWEKQTGLLLQPTRQRKGEYERVDVFVFSSQVTSEAFHAAAEDRGCHAKEE